MALLAGRPRTTPGLKEHSATGYTRHLLAARVQFLVEMIVVEIAAAIITGPVGPSLYHVPRLVFGS